jgi:hypothetical protein
MSMLLHSRSIPPGDQWIDDTLIRIVPTVITRNEWPSLFPETFDPAVSIDRGELCSVALTQIYDRPLATPRSVLCENINGAVYRWSALSLARAEYPGLGWAQCDLSDRELGTVLYGSRQVYSIVTGGPLVRVLAVLAPLSAVVEVGS